MQKQNRLSKNWQFQDVIAANKQFVTKYIVVYYVKNDIKKMRIGISISKKFAGAVERNLQKRQTRAVLDDINKTEMFLSRGLDVVLMLRKPFLDANFARKTTALKEAIDKLQESFGKI